MTNRSATKEAVVDRDSNRHAPLAMDAATFRSLGHRLVDLVEGPLESLPQDEMAYPSPYHQKTGFN